MTPREMIMEAFYDRRFRKRIDKLDRLARSFGASVYFGDENAVEYNGSMYDTGTLRQTETWLRHVKRYGLQEQSK